MLIIILNSNQKINIQTLINNQSYFKLNYKSYGLWCQILIKYNKIKEFEIEFNYIINKS